MRKNKFTKSEKSSNLLRVSINKISLSWIDNWANSLWRETINFVALRSITRLI